MATTTRRQAEHDAARPVRTSRVRLAIAATLAAACPAAAQDDPGFGIPGETPVQERIVGELVFTDDGPTPEAGDQIGAFFNDQLVGAFTIDDPDQLDFSFIVSGDDPATDDLVEGPATGEIVTFRYFDASTNTALTNVTAINNSGEALTYTFAGEDPMLPPGFPFPDDLIPLPTATFDIRVGGQDQGGGGGGDGDGGGSANLDLDGNGKVDVKDAALILRVVAGSRFGSIAAGDADVNGDGRVDVDDAVFILQRRD